MRREGTSDTLTVALARLGVFVVLICLWWVASQTVSRNLIPTPLDTALAAGRLWAEGKLPAALGTSLTTYLGGVTIAVAVGLPLGVLMGAFGLLGRTLEIYIYGLAATPRVAFIPLVIVLLGLGLEAKLFIVFLGAIMPIVINTYAGVRQADADLVEMARSVGAGRARIFRAIVLPGAVPYILTGLRIGATIGLINTVVAELYTAVSGLGGLLALYGNSFRMAEYFVIVLTLACVGVVVTELLRLLEARLTRWST
ncbi:NitT/TauT family transport system permease protein [Devosia lucknowensis]|uniref:NitT/TauT family transport system permease protein n=1 Tax=Devosia lucknowensis TaxID=1096929 RepID=A0A1Y6EAP2_9HYPH|nr:ABC transporter permease [Devosia lucknowensis]SMQ57990.1 NitT/TauT family transport system permease protein [Devosia lucknowensis]